MSRIGSIFVCLALIWNVSGCGPDGSTAGDGSTTEGSTDEGTTDEGTTDEGSTDEGSTDEGSTDEGTTDEGTTDEGTTDEGTTDEGTTDEGTTDEGTTDEGTTDEGTTDEGTTDEGTTDDPPNDPCDPNPCKNNGICVHGIELQITCDCSGTGYDGEFCETDLDECEGEVILCDINATCENTDGSYTCICDDGWEGDGTTCTDIDECATGNGDCGDAVYTTCTNNVGGPATCTDIDECAKDNGGCGDATFYSCTNNDGAAATCADIDECAEGTDDCDENSKCTNTNGSYECTCNYSLGMWQGSWSFAYVETCKDSSVDNLTFAMECGAATDDIVNCDYVIGGIQIGSCDVAVTSDACNSFNLAYSNCTLTEPDYSNTAVVSMDSKDSASGTFNASSGECGTVVITQIDCIPACAANGWNCGEDECGNSCGECPGIMTCKDNMCMDNPNVSLCEKSGGVWEKEKCNCPDGTNWDTETGCVEVTQATDACPEDTVLVGQFATWCGKVNVYTDPKTGSWMIDKNCNSGCNSAGVKYCNKYYPSAKKVVQIDVSEEKKPFMTAGCKIEYPHKGQNQFACCAPAE
jgi:hypothetical protein